MASCIDGLKDAAGNFFSDEQLNDTFQKLQDAQADAANNAADIHDRLKSAGDEVFNDHNLEEDLKEFSFYKNIEIKNNILKLVDRFKGRKNGLRDALVSYIDGTQKGLEGTRNSLELRIRQLESQTLDGFKTKLAKADVLPIWNSKEHEVEIANGLRDGAHENPQIDKIVKIVKGQSDQLHELYKKNGVFIKELDERITRNFHSKSKMMDTSDSHLQRVKDRSLSQGEQFEKAFQRWKNFTLPLLDKDKVFGKLHAEDEEHQEEVMRKAFATITNNGNIFDDPQSIQQLITARRFLHWKGGIEKVEYNKKYGMGTLHQAVETEFRNSSRQIASLERFGVNRNAMLKSVIKTAEEQNPEFKFQFKKKEAFTKVKRILDTATGSLEDPSSSIAIAGGNIRAGLNVAKLGGVVLKSLGDMSAIVQENKNIYGGFLASMKGSLEDFIKAKSNSEKAVFADLLKSYVNSEVGNSSRWFNAADAGTGMMTKLQSLAFKLNGLQFWDKSNRISLAISHARHLAMNKNFSFSDMIARDAKFDERNVRTLKLYDISGPEWDLIRKQPVKLDDGKGYIFPESADDISDQDINSLLKSEKVRNITQSKIDDRKVAIKNKLGMYFQDRIDHGILRPSAKDKDFWFMGTKSGQMIGQLTRMMAQYKLYGTTFISKPIARLIYGGGAETFWKGMLSGKSDRLGIVQLMAYGTVLGYLGLAASSISNNESPPSLDNLDTFVKSFSDGGGLGMYTNLLLGNHGGFNGTVLSQLAGPALGEMAKMFDLATSPIHGQFSTHQAFNLIKGNTPLINTFYMKYPLDYLFLNRIKEAQNPGYFNRKAAQLAKQGQHFILPPL